MKPMKTNAGETPAIQVAIVDDDSELRAHLAEFIGRFPEFQLAGSYADAESALAGLPSRRPQVVLMDINLPGMDGVSCVRALKRLLPETQIMMLTVYEDNDRLFNSLVAGASGYLLKRTAPDALIEAIRQVHAGGSPMTPQIARRVTQFFAETAVPRAELEGLTAHQRAFLDQLAQGYRYKEIAENLGISMDTVRSYVRRIYEKLHVHSRTEAVVKYLQR
jgi:DNA-binding NarL/FixJ family response regulator